MISYYFLTRAFRPFQRWWRRMLVAAIVATVVVPFGKEMLRSAVPSQQQKVIDLPAHKP